jgi:hypothetical protein
LDFRFWLANGPAAAAIAIRNDRQARIEDSTPSQFRLHIPRSGAPQAPQGPGSSDAAEFDAPPTANTESSFSTLELSHFLHATRVVDEGTIFSKTVPHSLHLNSKSGIRPSCWEYSQTALGLQLGSEPIRGFIIGAFFLVILKRSPLKSLDSPWLFD